MRDRIGWRARVAVVSLGVLLSSVALPSVASGQPVPVSAADRHGPGYADDARLRGKITT